MVSNEFTPTLTITADEAQKLLPHLRQAYRALASITAMHNGTGLRRQALESNAAAHRVLVLCKRLDALSYDVSASMTLSA